MFHPNKCVVYTFEDHVIRPGNLYDYVWCRIDVDVHKHEDFWEILIPAGDSYYHYCTGEESKITKETVFLFKPGAKHGLHKCSQKSVHFSFFAKDEFMEKFFHEHPRFRSLLGDEDYIMCELTKVEHTYLNKLAALLSYKNDEYQHISLLLYNVFALMILHGKRNVKKEDNNYIEDLVSKLNNYTYLNMKCNEIYNKYPIARCTLIQKFKEYTGMTIIQYQRKQKMIYAAQLLKSSDCKIIEISEQLNFDSLSHFMRLFKQYYGETPKEYRVKRRDFGE